MTNAMKFSKILILCNYINNFISDPDCKNKKNDMNPKIAIRIQKFLDAIFGEYELKDFDNYLPLIDSHLEGYNINYKIRASAYLIKRTIKNMDMPKLAMQKFFHYLVKDSLKLSNIKVYSLNGFSKFLDEQLTINENKGL